MKFKLKSGPANVGRILSIEADKDDELAYVDAERVYRGDLDSFLPLSYDREGKSYELSYYLGSCVSLNSLLAGPVAPDLLRGMLGSVLHLMQVCEQNGLSRLRVVMDPDYVYYDANLGLLRFAYVPLRAYVSETGEAGLVSRICSASVADAADQQFAVSMWDFVHRTSILTSVALEDFLEGWGLKTPDAGDKRSRKTRSALGADTRADHGWDFVTAIRQEDAQRQCDEVTCAPCEQEEGSRVSSGSGQVLVRVATGEGYVLAAGSNTLGRAADCTVSVPGSFSLSRKHAEIVVRESGCILRDLNSTNGTIVDGQRLQPGSEVSLHSGSRFTLGEERFLLR